MAKNIRPLAPILREEFAISFDRVDTGRYQKVTKKTVRDINAGLVVSEEDTTSEELYRLTLDDDFDHEIKFEDFDGKTASMRFKKVES